MISSPFVAAALQLQCTADRAKNLDQAMRLVDEAVRRGARFVASPENSDFIGPREERLSGAESLEGAFVATWRAKAKEHGIWLLLGSFAERTDGGAKVRNTSVLLSPEGAIASIYRKIHLFDANPPDGVPYRESELVERGAEVVVAQTPLAGLGLSICYDLRFPELYRQLSAHGADVLLVPSAFTVPTGEAHWEALLRARAIENLAYVLAPAQVGAHGSGRKSYGHALAIDPWGRVLGDAGGEGPGLVVAQIDPAELEKARRMIPALGHRRL